MMELLTHEQTLRLLKEAQNGSEEAKETLFIRNEALVKSIVRGFLNRGVEYEDLLSIGNLGFLKAINGYDPSFGVKFSTYAVPMIAGDIKRFLRDDGIIKVSRSVKEKSAKIFKLTEDLRKKAGRDPTIEELSQKLDMSKEDIVFAMEAAGAPCSLYEPVSKDGESDTKVIDIIEDTQSVDMIDKMLLKELLRELEPNERKLIFLRYFKDRTQEQIAKVMGISQVQVSRQLTKTINKMKKHVT